MILQESTERKRLQILIAHCQHPYVVDQPKYGCVVAIPVRAVRRRQAVAGNRSATGDGTVGSRNAQECLSINQAYEGGDRSEHFVRADVRVREHVDLRTE